MNCRSTESLFSAFLDDALSQSERRSFEAHLLGCRRCSHSLRELKGTLALLGDLAKAPAPELAPHFEDDLMARIRSGEAMRPTMVEWLQGLFAFDRLRPVLATGAAAVAVLVVLFLVRQPQDTTVTPGTTGLIATTSDDPVVETATTEDARTEPAAETVAIAPDAPTAPAARPATGSSLSAPDAQELHPALGDQPNGIIQIVDRVASEPSPALDSALPNPGALFADEYVTDRFYLQRAGSFIGPRQATSVPVSDRGSDDVYIEF